jgi:RecA-family ATPase
MNDHRDLLDILGHVDPGLLCYQDWVNVGMALKEAGFTAADWDAWSARDLARYHAGECFRKWDGFRGAGHPVGSGTIVRLAREQGWAPPRAAGRELDWDDAIDDDRDELRIVDKGWVEDREVTEPEDWNPVAHLVRYLETLFEASENVGYVTESWDKDGRYLPTKGSWDRTAGELIQQLQKCGGDIGAILGDCKPEAGAWIRFNPLDGKGCKNENVSEYRYALVESDDMPIERQSAMIRELELPVACLVHSGGKSLHAIVRVEAANYDEYRKRVDYLYDVCRKNGMTIDAQNKNPSRLSRMPGVTRGGRKQYLVDTRIGKGSWKEWQEWIEGVNDDLPNPESIADVWDELPELSPPLIDGVLRQGHKLLLAGPSKAGKSYALTALCCAIAEGRKWLRWPCAKGRVLYVNLELDRASCLHRFRDVYAALGWRPDNLANLDVWNLRGKAVPMDKLAPKLIRRAQKKNYIAVIIDPIYKVITGDENSADQMAAFCNQFDRVCTDLGCAVIYCHHHSKGSQGQKRSMDRASGSGVFARDPDALLDLIELDVTDALRKQEENKAVCAAYAGFLNDRVPDWTDAIPQDDRCAQGPFLAACERLLAPADYDAIRNEAMVAQHLLKQRTAWRVEGTLREFPKFEPVNCWFDYPVHHLDQAGSLGDLDAEGQAPPWQKATVKRKEKAKDARNTKKNQFDHAVQSCNFGDPPTVKQLAEALDLEERTVRNHAKAYGYIIEKDSGKVFARGKDHA